MDEIKVVINGITYSNKDNGFYILKVTDPKSRSSFSVKGSFIGVNLNIGLKLKLYGEWIDHNKFGKQFNSVQFEIMKEDGQHGVVNYLISHVPSIGPITASKLYSKFGDDLINILNSNPESIKEAEFLTSKQVESIIDEWKVASSMRTVAIILSDLGLNSNQIKTIYKKWGIDTKKILDENPYRLCECEGVGFASADSVARKLGIGVDDIKRTCAIILFILKELASNGHMYATSNMIISNSSDIFRRSNIEPFSHGSYMSDIFLYKAMSSLVNDGYVVSNNDKIYLKNNWKYETEAAEVISEMVSQESKIKIDLDAVLNEFESIKKISLSSEQKQAFCLLKNSNIITISGFPGTGKTLLTSAFVFLFEKLCLNYSLMSPTGIAAKRASQVTGKIASTIHRALGCKIDGGWEFNRSNKYYTDAVIVDEMSMVDSSTFYNLVSALPKSTILIFIGDSEQLPSVGAGHVLKNLMSSSVPHVSLTHIYRQEKQSDIIKVAHQILNNQVVDLSFVKDSDFLFFEYTKEVVVDEICKITSLMKERGSNFQVISPMYDGILGVNNLNKKLRTVLNSDYNDNSPSKIKHGDVDLYEGDRIMVIKNDYERMIFNGDVGKVQRISIRDDEVEIKIFNWFDHESQFPRYIEKIFTYKIEEAKRDLRISYASTIHRCQGQEFDYVILPMTTQYGIMLYKNLVYTAITRAKKKVFVLGESLAFRLAITNNREIQRNSSLSELIDENINLNKRTEN